MVIHVPHTVIQEVAKQEENLGYYIEIGRNALKRKYSSSDYNRAQYDCYSVSLVTIPTNLITLILELWKKEAENGDYIQEEDEEKYEKAKSHYDSQLQDLVQFVDELKKNSKKLRRAKNFEDALMLLNTLFRSELKDNGWIYRKDMKNDRHYPFLVGKIQIQEDRYDGRRRWIEIELLQNSEHETSTTKISIDSAELRMHKNSVVDTIRANNILFETDELKKEYEEYIQDFYDKENTQNIQYIDKNGMKYINDNVYQMEQTKGRFTKKINLFSFSQLVNHAENCPIPYNPLIYMFNLNKHQFEWVDTRDIKEYVYDENIVDKLILPEDHKGLIDILTNDVINDNGDDIIKGKSGGTAVLCRGEAGLGKTLTAEVYSEIKKKPLYSVHSGQLGIAGTEIEKELKIRFERAERWGAVLLIDEADVYIRVRDNDTNHNAIVASFLRTMEYYNGLMFMTTNRSDDIDDAILSRCMAVLTYKKPKDDVKAKMWSIYLEQFNIKHDDKFIEDLNKEFDEVSGRDIKNITRLASRYMQGYGIKEPSVDVFVKCAIFRGIKEFTE